MSLYVGELLLPHFSHSPLDLFDAGRKATYFSHLFEDFFGVMESGPGIRDIKKERVSLNVSSLNLKPVTDNISPGRSDVLFPKVGEELFGDFGPLFVELESIQVSLIRDVL